MLDFGVLGWKSLGVLELTALPSLDDALWGPMVQETDVLLVNGGDPWYLCSGMRQSGLADRLPSLRAVYVGLSAGSLVMTPNIGAGFVGWTPPACRCRRTPSTIRPLSPWSTEPSTSSPRGTGRALPPETTRLSRFARDFLLRWPTL